MSESPQIVLRLDAETLARVEAHVERLRRATPGLAVTRAAALRTLVLAALDVVESKDSTAKK